MKLCTLKKFDDKESAEAELKKLRKHYRYAYRSYSVQPCWNCGGWHIALGGPVRGR